MIRLFLKKKSNLYYAFIIFPLLISLFIYLFFRSENIVVNQILYQLFHINLPALSYPLLKGFFIYNLPQGLWVFSATLISRNLYIKKFNLAFFPLVFSFYIEAIQYFHLTNGTFDFFDLLTASISCLLGYFFIPCPYKPQRLMNEFNLRTFSFGCSYLIVFLSIYNRHHYFLGIFKQFLF